MHPALPPMTTWNLDFVQIGALALLLVGYLFAIGPVRTHRNEAPVSHARVLAFVGGWLSLVLALISPLDTLGRYYSFAAHSLQLFIIITLSTPLILWGMPEWLIWQVLPTRRLRDATRGLVFPIVATVLFNAGILFWHIGPMFTLGATSEPVHLVENLTFVLAGFLTWWPLLTPLDTHTRLSNPVQMLYLVFESLPLDIFGVFALFAVRVFYPLYEHAPHLFGLSVIEDQAAGGAILAVPGNVIDIILMSIVFFGWLRNMDQAQQERERAAFENESATETAPPGISAE